MNGIIVALKGKDCTGKTQTLKELVRTLLNGRVIYMSWEDDTILDNDKEDVRLIVVFDGIIIGVDTQGDTGAKLEEMLLNKRLDEMKNKYNCSLIFCACKSYGKSENGTYGMVESFARTHNFGFLGTSTYYSEVAGLYPDINTLNKIRAKELLAFGLSISKNK